MPNIWQRALSGEDIPATDGAKTMNNIAEEAGQAGWDRLMEVIDGSDLTDHRKVGAAITAAAKLYAVLLEAMTTDRFGSHHAKLTVGMFDTLVDERIAELRLKAAQED